MNSCLPKCQSYEQCSINFIFYLSSPDVYPACRPCHGWRTVTPADWIYDIPYTLGPECFFVESTHFVKHSTQSVHHAGRAEGLGKVQHYRHYLTLCQTLPTISAPSGPRRMFWGKYTLQTLLEIFAKHSHTPCTMRGAPKGWGKYTLQALLDSLPKTPHTHTHSVHNAGLAEGLEKVHTTGIN